MSRRAVKHARKTLGTKLRALRKGHGLSQERLGAMFNLSGKFIGEVERGEKSIPMDSLWRIAAALEVSLRDLADDGPVTERGEKIAEIMPPLSWKNPGGLARAYPVLHALFGK